MKRQNSALTQRIYTSISSFLLVGLCLFAASPGALAATYTNAAAYTPTSGITFNYPFGSTAQQYQIITKINATIDATPATATIRVATYGFDEQSSADKLVSAYKRGVHVKVLVDGVQNKTPQTAELTKALGTDKTKDSYFTTCVMSCMSSSYSIMHAKLYMFSTAGSAQLVSMISSANLTVTNAERSWNDLETLIGDNDIYRSNLQYFTDMVADHDDPNYFRTLVSGNYKLFYYPQPASVENTLTSILDHVSCTGVTGDFGYEGRTVIRISTYYWDNTMLSLAQKLWDMDNEGCEIQIIDNSLTTTPEVTAALLKPGDTYGLMSVYDGRYDINHDGKADDYMHQKYIAIDGKYYGNPQSKVVYTGSMNISWNSFRNNNEILLRMDADRDTDTFMAHFRYVRDNFTTRETAPPDPT